MMVRIIVFLAAICSLQVLKSQVQVGVDLDGEAAGNQFGSSVSMPDAQTVAIGGNSNDANGVNAGHVRIFEWTGTAWQQKGADIDGEASGEFSGTAVSMPDAETVAIGAFGSDVSGNESGQVRVYEWTGSAWQQKGVGINGETAIDWFGFSVSMPDAQTVGIGAWRNDANGNEAGRVQIYEWTGTAWHQKGTSIDGEAAGDESGASISMPDAQTIAIGASHNAGNGFEAGHVRIYEWDGTDWRQKGTDIDGEAATDLSGTSVSMPDAQTVAIGAPSNDGGGSSSGHVRVYEWDGTTWQQKGPDIDGDVLINSGITVSMPDAQTVAIGATLDDATANNAGHVRIYEWNGTAWQQKGMDIDGEAERDFSGSAISMPDAETVAIGASVNDGNGENAGHVRVYSLADVTSINLWNWENTAAYPNPTTGPISIDLGATFTDVSVVVRNVLGQEIMKQRHPFTKQVDLEIEGQIGIYFIEVVSGNKKSVFEVVKE